jgi:hypothetical protein
MREGALTPANIGASGNLMAATRVALEASMRREGVTVNEWPRGSIQGRILSGTASRQSPAGIPQQQGVHCARSPRHAWEVR